MGLAGRARNWLRSIVARQRLEREMLEEMSAHIEQAAERFRARGMSERDALLAARREFGQAGVVQEDALDARGSRWVDSVVGDLRFALRQCARTPLMSGTIILTLTLGIGATATMFSVTNGIFNRPPPGIPDDDAVVMIRGIGEGGVRERLLSWPEVTDYAALSDRFSAVAALVTKNVIANIDGGGGTDGVSAVRAQFVTPNFFATLGVRLAAGAGFVQTRFTGVSDPELTTVLGATIAEQLGGPAQVVGKEIKLNGVAVRVVGVAPRGFNGPLRYYDARTLWMPLSSYPLIMGSGAQLFSRRDTGAFRAVARLQPGVATTAATGAVRVVASRAETNVRPAERTPTNADVIVLRGNTTVRGVTADEIAQTALGGATVLLILLVCTTTVSSLLIGAAVARRQEIGVRLALGASRARVARQLVTETAMLALAGGALGLALFAAVCRAIAAAIVKIDITPDWTTAGFTVVSAMITALLCGLSPALHATRSGVADALKDGARVATSRSRLQRTFVVAQIALTQPLLVGLALLMWAALSRLTRPGSVVNSHLVVAEFEPNAMATSSDPMPNVMRRLASMPGVTAVVPSPIWNGPMTLEVAPSGAIAPTTFRASASGVAPGHFRAFDIKVVMGREFVDGDTAAGATPHVIIETDAAARLFGASNPIGKRLYELSNDGQRVGDMEIVGVVATQQIGARKDADRPLTVFMPYRSTRRVDALKIRTSVRAEEQLAAMRALVRAEAPMLPITLLQTLEQEENQRREFQLVESGMWAAGGAVVLLLASVGLYAVVAIAVGQRRREIGVRVALGATPRQVVTMFFNGGLRLCLVGLLIGLPLSGAAMKILGSQVGAARTSTALIAVAMAVAAVVAVASLATWLPARRAAGVDPLIALRSG